MPLMVLLHATAETSDQLAARLRAAAETIETHHVPDVIRGDGWWADIHEPCRAVDDLPDPYPNFPCSPEPIATEET